MKKLIEEVSKEKRYRASVFIDVWAQTEEQAYEQMKAIQKTIPNSYIGEVYSL